MTSLTLSPGRKKDLRKQIGAAGLDGDVWDGEKIPQMLNLVPEAWGGELGPFIPPEELLVRFPGLPDSRYDKPPIGREGETQQFSQL